MLPFSDLTSLSKTEKNSSLPSVPESIFFNEVINQGKATVERDGMANIISSVLLRIFVAERTDAAAVFEFGKDLDVVTIEIENVNVDALEDLEKEGIKVYPASKTLRTIQNKAQQKLFYIDN